jgi:SPP1 gp7 family putative phage head morphogenesis protein
MAKPDYAHRMTDAELAQLERRISAIYQQAADELSDTVNAYFEQFEKRDAAMKEKLDAGEITDQQYKQWRLAQIGRGKRFTALRDKVAERYTYANATAVAYVNDATPGIYSLNRNYAAYKIEQVSDKADFTLWDEQTVKRLIDEQPDLMPYYQPKRALQRGIDLKYGKQQITASVTSSILQGKSIPKIANDLQQRMRDMSRASAIRTARTAVTAAQNAGRLDTYRAAQDMGIKLKKRWLATLDNRTRHAHAMLDGQTVDVDKPFKVDGYELMYPGDTSAPGYLVYNCRCTQIAEVDGEDTSSGGRRARNPKTGESVLVGDMTYAEWAGWKKQNQPKMPRFTPATTIEEAQKYADKFVESYKTKYSGKVDYSGIDIEYANKMNRAFTEVLEQYAVPNKLRNIVPFNMREKRFKDTTAEAAYQWGLSDFYYNKKYLKSAKTMAAHKKEYADLLEKVLPNIDKAIEINDGKSNATATLQLRYLKALKNTGRTNVFEPDAYGTTIHELGHYLDDQIFTKAAKESGLDITESFNNYSGKISAYATSSRQEYVAESFAAYWKGEKDIIDPKLFDLFERLKNGK